MANTYVIHNPFTNKSYDYTTRDDKEEKLFSALDMVLEDKCPPDREDYLCQASEDESTDEETCKKCWMCWATKEFGHSRR